LAKTAKSSPAPGQRFTPRSHPQSVWEVVKVYEGTDGIAYAQLRSIADPSRLKTVSGAALRQRSLWLIVPDPRRGSDQ
jgi:hypothetical protein